MYDLRSLKQVVIQTETKVNCPVKNCDEILPRMRRSDSPKDPKFICPKHRITVSPSTFTYEKSMENILWKDRSDIALYDQIATVKREKFRRNGHNNSEDALSWNVFRYLEKNGLNEFSSHLLGNQVDYSDLIYWTYDQSTKFVWNPLAKGWKEFELVTSGHRSEPDLILKTESDLVFIEAKLKSGNNTTISPERAEKVKDKYVNSADRWFSEVFTGDFDDLVFNEKKYELMRFWVLGTWIAEKEELDFTLLNLVRERSEKQIETLYGRHLSQNKTRRFTRITWEDIYCYISRIPGNNDQEKMLAYFRNRSLGYSNGNVIKAFSI